MNCLNKLLGMILAVGLFAGPAAAEIREDLNSNVNQNFVTTPNGARAQKFEEYHPRPNGVTLDLYRIDADYENGYQFSCLVKNVQQADQSYACSGGKPGALTYKASWDQSPHLFSNQARTLYFMDPNGAMHLATAMRNTFQINAFPTNAATNNAYYADPITGIGSYLATSPMVRSALRIDTANLDLKYRPMRDLVVTIGATRSHKTGNRPFGAPFGFNNDIEVLAPLDHVTNEARLGVEYAKPTHQVAFRYSLSDFHNGLGTLIWDNPKRLTDQYSTFITAGHTAGASGYAGGDQSARGQMALAPDNQAHMFNLSGGVDMPFESHLSGELGFSRMEASNPMQPFTINSAINPANAQTGVYNTAPFDASNPANLPSSTINSRINAYNQLYRLTNKSLPRTRTTIEYRSYQQDNISDVYFFPGYVRLDEAWESEELANKRESFRNERVGMNLDFEMTRAVNLGLGIGEEFRKQAREVSKSREHQFEASTQYRPVHNLFFNLSYFLGLRRMNGYDLQDFFTDQVTNGTVTTAHAFGEDPGLRRFDVTDRNRNRVRFQTQYTADNDATLGINALINQDEFRPGKGDLQGFDAIHNGVTPLSGEQYGLLSDRSTTVGVEASLPVRENWEIDTYCDYEYSRRIVHGNQPAAGNATQDPADDWTFRAGENEYIGGLTVSWTPRAGMKSSVGYDILSSNLHQDPIAVGSSARVVNARSLSPTRRIKQTLTVSQGYQLAKNLKLLGRYAYEKFDVQDFALGDVPLTTPNADSIFLGASLRGYYAHLFSLGVDYRF